MEPKYNEKSESISAPCPECEGVVTSFDRMNPDGTKLSKFSKGQTEYLLLKCSRCGRGGFAAVRSRHAHGVTPFAPTSWAIDEFFSLYLGSISPPPFLSRLVIAFSFFGFRISLRLNDHVSSFL